MRRVVFDTNVLVDWMRSQAHDVLLHHADDVRYLSAVVLMELRAGARTRAANRAVDVLRTAHEAHHRCLAPSVADLDRAGVVIKKLRALGVGTRGPGFVNDVLIALAARSVGAWLITQDAGFADVRRALDFKLVLVGGARPTKPQVR